MTQETDSKAFALDTPNYVENDAMTSLDQFIKSVVEDRGPIKGVELALEVAKHQHGVGEGDFHEAIERLMKEGEIIELDYVLPSMDYRTKSMYFPKGTKLARAL